MNELGMTSYKKESRLRQHVLALYDLRPLTFPNVQDYSIHTKV